MRSLAIIIALALALTSANSHGRPNSARKTVMSNMKPLMQKMEEGAKLSPEAKLRFCVGEPFASARLTPALKTCGIPMVQHDDKVGMRIDKGWEQQMEDKECILAALAWTNNTGPIRSNVKADLALTSVGNHVLAEAETACFDRSDQVSARTVSSILKGDCSGLMGNAAAGGRTDDVRRARFGHAGSGTAYLGTGVFGRFPGRLPLQMQATLINLIPLVKEMVYFGCLHHSFEEECAKEANDILIEIGNGQSSTSSTTPLATTLAG